MAMMAWQPVRGETTGRAVMALAAVLVALLLSSCGLSPMYAERADVGGAAGWEQVDVAPPANRLEQLVFTELLRNRPPEKSGGRPYELSFTVQEDEAATLGSRLWRVRLKADFSLKERASGKVLMRGRTFGDASYEKTRMHFADASARDAARKTAAKLIAEDMRRQVVAFFARGMPATARPPAAAAARP